VVVEGGGSKIVSVSNTGHYSKNMHASTTWS
jgi:hypothetical protein